MLKRCLRIIAAFSLAITMFMMGGAASVSAASVSISELRASLASLEKREAENRNTVAALVAKIAEEKAGCEKLQNKVQTLQAVLSLDETALSGAYAEAAAALSETERRAQDMKARGERLAAEKEEVLAAIDAWNKAYDETLAAARFNAEGTEEAQAASAAVTAFTWPIPGYTLITCDYGEDDHRGVDIAGNAIFGEPIVAAKRGTVSFSGWHDSYGYCVFLEHGNGLQTRYAHASRLDCVLGDTVEAGQVIAYIGSTGNSTGPHLHFEILQDGQLQNPLAVF